MCPELPYGPHDYRPAVRTSRAFEAVGRLVIRGTAPCAEAWRYGIYGFQPAPPQMVPLDPSTPPLDRHLGLTVLTVPLCCRRTELRTIVLRLAPN